MDKLSIGAILPNTRLFGGVRRFFELGRIWKSWGCDVVIFTPDGSPASWFSDPAVEVDKISNLNQHKLDALFFTQVSFLPDVLTAKVTNKILYHVGPRAKLKAVLRHPEIKIWVNSTTMLEHDRSKYGIEPERAFGGVHLAQPVLYSLDERFADINPFVVMAFGRLSRKGKGTMLVVKACERLYKRGIPIKLLLYDTPIDNTSSKLIGDFKTSVPSEFVLNHPVDENAALFKRAHVFVSAEKKGGWSNSSAEAMASGVPVIGTSTGTSDFLIQGETGLVVWRMSYFIRRAIFKLYENPELRIRLAEAGRKKIEQFSWENLAGKILGVLKSNVSR